MSSDEEEMSDQFEEQDAPQNPFGFVPGDNVDNLNKPEKPLLEQYQETRVAEEAGHAARRRAAQDRIRVCLAQNPKLEIGKLSAQQEKMDAMTVEQLEAAALSMEDQLGVSSILTLPKGVLMATNTLLQQFGMKIDPQAFEDAQFLGAIAQLLPNVLPYTNYIQVGFKSLQYLVMPEKVVEPIDLSSPPSVDMNVPD